MNPMSAMNYPTNNYPAVNYSTNAQNTYNPQQAMQQQLLQNIQAQLSTLQASTNTQKQAAPSYNTSTNFRQPNNAMYGIQQLGIQNHLPVNKERQLTEKERDKIEEAQRKNWLPGLTRNLGSDPTDYMANPLKVGIVKSLISGAFLGGLGVFIGRMMGHSDDLIEVAGSIDKAKVAIKNLKNRNRKIGLLIGIGFGLLGGIGAALKQARKNGSYEHLMARFPEGATMRDLLSDPALQASLDRHAMRHRR